MSNQSKNNIYFVNKVQMPTFIDLEENFRLYESSSQIVIKNSREFMEKFKMGHGTARDISYLIQMLPNSNK